MADEIRVMLGGIFPFQGGGWGAAPPRAVKILSWNCRGLGNPAIVTELRQLLVANVPDIIFLCETKLHKCDFDRISKRLNMAGCFVVDVVGRKGGLALLWSDECDVDVQSFLQNHVDSLIKMDMSRIRFTGFYGYPDLTRRHLSWELIRNIGSRVHEDWIIGGDFNEILNDSKKCGGRHKSWVAMEEFRKVIEEMALVDLKL